MAKDLNSFFSLEMKRAELERNVAKLQATLRHWQQWEIEYEGMKEDILALGEASTLEQLQDTKINKDLCGSSLFTSQTACLDSNGELEVCVMVKVLSKQERSKLLYDERGNLRSSDQVVGLLSRRIEYVQQNVQTALSQLESTRSQLVKLMALNGAETSPRDAGLPLTEIHEELDEEGNILSSSVSELDQTAPQVLEALQDVGVDDVLDNEPGAKAHIVTIADSQSRQRFLEPPSFQSDAAQEAFSEQSSAASSRSNSGKGARPDRLKKRVSFANNTKSEPAPAPHPRSLPIREREQLFREICSQVEEEVGKDPVSRKFREWHESGMFGEEVLSEMLKARKLGIADRFLKLPAFKETRRLFKAENLNRSQAAQHILLMIEESKYRLPFEDRTFISNASTNGDVTNHEPESSSDDYALDESAEPEPEGIFDILTRTTGDHSEVRDEFMKIFDEQLRSAVLAMGELIVNGEMTTIEQLKSLRQLLDNRTQIIESARSKSVQDITRGCNERDALSEESENGAGKPLLMKSLSLGEHTVSSKDESGAVSHSHIFPVNESAEDAALRREMIQYNMGEVGVVVAELDLDDETTEPSDEEDHREVDYGSTSPEEDADDEEDKFGRSATRVLNNDYLAEMQALENKLKTKTTVNVGPNAFVPDPLLAMSDVSGEPLKNGMEQDDADKKPNATKSKGVRFAAELDIQQAPDKNKPSLGIKETMARNASDESNSNSAPLKAPHASTIVERPWAASDPGKTAQEPDDLDSAFLKHQVSTEYHHMRNKMIQREGGFLARDDEKAEVPLAEDEGGPKKVSRFKAARLGQR